MDVAALLSARCVARLSGGKYSSLVLGGRGGLPLDPGGPLPSPLVLDARLVADSAETDEDGRQRLPPPFALLAIEEKVLPRMQRAHLSNRSPAALVRRCSN